MNKTALLAQLAAKTAAAQALIGKGESGTAEDVTAAKGLTEEIKALRGQIADIEAIEAEVRGASDYMTKAGPGLPGKSTEFKREGKSGGTDLVEVRMNGKSVRVDHDGFEVSEKQFRAMQEDAYIRAYRQFLRRGVNNLDADSLKVLSEVKAYQVGDDSLGGFLVPPQMLAEIVSRDIHGSDLLSQVRTVPVTRDGFTVPKYGYAVGDGDIYNNSLRIQRVGETQAPVTVVDQKLGLIEVKMHSGSMEVPMTREFATDAAIDPMAWVAEMMKDSFDLDTVNELTNGDGLKQPEGFLTNSGATNGIPEINIGNPVTGDGLIDAFYGLPRQYRQNARWMLNDTNTYRTWAKLKDTSGAYIGGTIDRNLTGLGAERSEVILGKLLTENPFMPDPGAASKVAVIGDFARTYYYGLRLAMMLEIQMLPRDAFAYAVFRFRNGGRVIQPRASRVLKQS